MKKTLIYSLFLTIGLVVGYTAAVSFGTVSKPGPYQVDPDRYKVVSSELRFIESSLDCMHKIKSNPVPGEWLFYNQESQQYPGEYLDVHPSFIKGQREKVYIQPIGTFSSKQYEIMYITAEYLEVFYGLPVEILDSISITEVPKEARRHNELHQWEQLQTRYILDKILKPRLPKDARAYLGFTPYDLYPNDNYNFVFGQGRIGGNVGVYSIARFGLPEINEEQFTLCLLRTLKVSSHELGHILGFSHCVHYECLMNGSNDLKETDAKPYNLCPYELVKVTHAGAIDYTYRFKKIAAFWEKYNIPGAQKFYQTCDSLLEANLSHREDNPFEFGN